MQEVLYGIHPVDSTLLLFWLVLLVRKAIKQLIFFRKVQSIEFLNKVMQKKGDRKHLLVGFALIERNKIFPHLQTLPSLSSCIISEKKSIGNYL